MSSRIVDLLDEQAYAYLETANPDMLKAIEQEVDGGMSPDEIYRLIVHNLPYHDPVPFARKCQAAARHYRSMK